MKIIKQGNKTNLKETKHFLCGFCGCEFEADKGEYIVGEQYNSEYYCFPCPTCGKTVYSRK